MKRDNATKIVATISDQRCSVEFLEKVIAEGVNVVRMNSAHMTREGFDRVIGNVRQVSNQVALLMDTKGPEVRTTNSEAPIYFFTGDKVKIIADPNALTTKEVISVNYAGFVTDVSEGTGILIDDGLIEIKVLSKDATALYCEVQNDGELGSRKSINVPGIRLNLPSLSEKDHFSIQYSIENGVDFIAHSFVRSKEDVYEIQRILDEHNSPTKIIAKIENQEGVNNIDEIIDACYGIMVARGDLGIEVEMEKIPAIQAMIVHKCIMKKKPVIVATQMLHTMINSPRPTRAEVSDVTSAILMNTDAVMLSGETAYGKYPVEAVRTMASIIREAEQHKYHKGDFRIRRTEDEELDVTNFLAKQTVKAVEKLGVKAIINDAVTGRTARNLSAYRGSAPVYAICFSDRQCRELALSYGIHALYRKESGVRDKGVFYHDALQDLLERKQLEKGDLVAYLGGTLQDEVGTTTLMINRAEDAVSFYESIPPKEH